jgi:hypothetical protein
MLLIGDMSLDDSNCVAAPRGSGVARFCWIIPSGLFRLRLPVSSRQQGELSIVSGIDVTPIVWLIDRIEHYLHEDTADGMNGLMAVEPFVQQPFERLGHRVYSPSATWFSTTTWAMA